MSLQALIGARIKQFREAKGWTQEELAGMARSDAATLSRIESGKRNVTAETLALFIAARQGESIKPTVNFSNPDDKFSTFILERKANLLRRKRRKGRA